MNLIGISYQALKLIGEFYAFISFLKVTCRCTYLDICERWGNRKLFITWDFLIISAHESRVFDLLIIWCHRRWMTSLHHFEHFLTCFTQYTLLQVLTKLFWGNVWTYRHLREHRVEQCKQCKHIYLVDIYICV